MCDSLELQQGKAALDASAQDALREWTDEAGKLWLLTRDLHVDALKQLIAELGVLDSDAREFTDALLITVSNENTVDEESRTEVGLEPAVADETPASQISGSMDTKKLLRTLTKMGMQLTPGGSGHLKVRNPQTGEHSVLAIHSRTEFGRTILRCFFKQLGC